MAKTWEVDFLQSRKPIEAEFKGSAVYKLPIASPEELGGVKPVAKTEDMVQPVGVDAEGALWVAESLIDGKLVDVVKSINGQTPDENGNIDLTGYATEQYVNEQIAKIPTPDVSGQIDAHNIAVDSHSDIRSLIDGLTSRLNEMDDNFKFKTDETLTLEKGILSVNTTNDMERDNTLPITSAGVYATVGNIEALLKTI